MLVQWDSGVSTSFYGQFVSTQAKFGDATTFYMIFNIMEIWFKAGGGLNFQLVVLQHERHRRYDENVRVASRSEVHGHRS